MISFLFLQHFSPLSPPSLFSVIEPLRNRNWKIEMSAQKGNALSRSVFSIPLAISTRVQNAAHSSFISQEDFSHREESYLVMACNSTSYRLVPFLSPIPCCPFTEYQVLQHPSHYSSSHVSLYSLKGLFIQHRDAALKTVHGISCHFP